MNICTLLVLFEQSCQKVIPLLPQHCTLTYLVVAILAVKANKAFPLSCRILCQDCRATFNFGGALISKFQPPLCIVRSYRTYMHKQAAAILVYVPKLLQLASHLRIYLMKCTGKHRKPLLQLISSAVYNSLCACIWNSREDIVNSSPEIILHLTWWIVTCRKTK